MKKKQTYKLTWAQEKQYKFMKAEGHSKVVMAKRMEIPYLTLQKATAGW